MKSEAAEAVMSDAATEATTTTKTTGKKVATSLCKVTVKSLQVGKAILGRGAKVRLTSDAAAELEKMKKVAILVETK